MTIHELISRGWPGKAYSLRFNDGTDEEALAALDWRDPSPKPTLAELAAMRDQLAAADAAVAVQAEQDATEREGIRALLSDLRNGTGTNAERIRRLELVAIRLIKDALR